MKPLRTDAEKDPKQFNFLVQENENQFQEHLFLSNTIV